MPCAFYAERLWPFLNTPPYCQFEVPESELLSIDGELWCEYHAPIENKNMEKIEKGSWDGDAIKFLTKKY